jgi:hypothetical protein
MRVCVLSLTLVALATTLSLRAAARPSSSLSEVLARAANATAAFATPSHRISCQENARQTLVADPLPVPLDWSHNPTPWAYRDIVASWSLTASSADGSDAWEEVRTPGPLEPFQPFPSKRAVDASITAMVDEAMDVPTPLARLAAVFLSARNQPRFEFSKGDETEVDGLTVWEVKFRETASPSLGALPISGSVWIDASTGRVVRSAIAVRSEATISDSMTVGYRLDPATGFYLPHTLTRRTHVTNERVGSGVGGAGNLRLWVQTTGTFTGCRVSPASATGLTVRVTGSVRLNALVGSVFT